MGGRLLKFFVDAIDMFLREMLLLVDEGGGKSYWFDVVIFKRSLL